MVKYRNGKTLHGILLALGDGSIRVAIKGSDDAAVYRLFNGAWISEDCEVVTFEFPDDGFAGRDDSTLREAIFPSHSEASAVQRIM